MSYRGRLAPTPSGLLHLGHARTFWHAWQRCRLQQGCLLLRHDDLDQERCQPQFLAAAEEDLVWLGLDWQEGPYYQSHRLHLYEQAFEQLKASGAIYPCSCSRKEVALAQRAPHAADEEPVYAGTCRHGLKPGASPRCWRLRVQDGQAVEFVDQAQGPQKFLAGSDFGDFVVWRPAVGASYQLACVVDDALLGITEVVRGQDLLLSTARQWLLYQALGWKPPEFFHCPLVLDEQGQRLAKRHDALALRTLRQRGETREEILARFSEV